MLREWFASRPLRALLGAVRGAGGGLVLTLLACAPVAADLVYFKGGGQAQLPAEVEGTTVRLLTPDGRFAFHRDDFRKVVPGSWPEQEWAGRRASALDGGVEARYEAAWWALGHGLTPQAEALLREAHAADPGHAPTARMVAMLDRLAAPLPDPDLSSLRETLGVATEVTRGPHVVLLHQHGPADVAERIDVVERVIATYYLSMAAQGLELRVPDRRLVSVWFARRDDYLAYLHAEGADAFRSTTGYFHPTKGVVLAYDPRGDDPQRTAREALLARRREIEAARDRLPARGRVRLSVGPAAPRILDRAGAEARLDRLGREVDRQQLLLDLDRRTVDLGTAAHETVHQLVDLSGLAPRHDDFPHWLHEGLAAQFEVLRGGRWAGLGKAHDVRLPDWRKIPSPPRLAPLIRDEGFGRGYHPDLYAQAWALVYYLRKEHPREFLAFLDLLRSPGHDPRPRAERSLAAFQAAFPGDLPSLESSWHEFMSKLRTPLEEADRAP